MKYTASLVLAITIIIIAIFIGSLIGEISISLNHFIKILSNHLFNTHFAIDIFEDNIIWNIRLPRVIIAALTGAGLALSSAILQILFRNPLAEPYLLGVSSGASFGGVFSLILGFNSNSLSFNLCAFLGAILAFSVVFLFSNLIGKNNLSILLCGLAIGQFFSAASALLLSIGGDITIRGQIYDWLFGSLSGMDWHNVYLLSFTSVISFSICFILSPKLDALFFGEKTAKSLGVSVSKLNLLFILTIALLSSVIVSIVGLIGFIGLITPHISRLIIGYKHHILLPFSAFLGALLMILADIISRILIPGFSLSIGIITAFIAAPIFILILLQKQKYDDF